MMNHEHFSRKIPAYFDGTLSEAERTEFEAYVGTHPEFATLFRDKSLEHEELRRSIPEHILGAQALEPLESEVKEIIHNLFYDEQSSASERLRGWLREKL